MPDLFIWYATEDEEFAVRLRSALEERGRDVWFDRAEELGEGIEPADRWRLSATEAAVFPDRILTGVAFGSDGHTVISNGPLSFGGPLTYRQTFGCDVCGQIDFLVSLARRRVSRTLTALERRQYLH